MLPGIYLSARVLINYGLVPRPPGVLAGDLSPRHSVSLPSLQVRFVLINVLLNIRQITRDIFSSGKVDVHVEQLLILNRQNIDNIARSMRNTQKKRDILTEKQESEMTLEKRDFLPESGNVDPYGFN